MVNTRRPRSRSLASHQEEILGVQDWDAGVARACVTLPHSLLAILASQTLPLFWGLPPPEPEARMSIKALL